MKPLVKVTPIGVWDFGRMRSHTYRTRAVLQVDHLWSWRAELSNHTFWLLDDVRMGVLLINQWSLSSFHYISSC
jgi:hypothetical protein